VISYNTYHILLNSRKDILVVHMKT